MEACASAPSTSGRCIAGNGAAAAAARPLKVSTRRATMRQPMHTRHRGHHHHLAAAAGGGGKPDWLRDLEESAEYDEAAARLLAGTNGDPSVVQQRMRADMDALHSRIMGTRYGGEDAPMDVSFRDVDQFNLWVWLELYRPPTQNDLDMLQEVINSWFLLGRLGGFNSSNLQVLYHQDGDLEDMAYDQEEAGLPASFHDMSPLETKGSWSRFWLDMGTSDELALDVLINTLTNFSKEQLGIRQLVVGGQNDDWTVPLRDDFLPEVTMDPLRGPLGGDEDDEDEEEAGGAWRP